MKRREKKGYERQTPYEKKVIEEMKREGSRKVGPNLRDDGCSCAGMTT